MSDQIAVVPGRTRLLLAVSGAGVRTLLPDAEVPLAGAGVALSAGYTAYCRGEAGGTAWVVAGGEGDATGGTAVVGMELLKEGG